MRILPSAVALDNLRDGMSRGRNRVIVRLLRYHDRWHDNVTADVTNGCPWKCRNT